ncbi:FAD-dependent monooxygenase [Pigmentiphaga soli]
MDNTRQDPRVIIVGGGPVGLALAGDLGWRGIPCLLIEQTDGTITQPKMDGINVRTMEFCRRWGLVEQIRACPYPSSYPQDMVYLTSLNGYELGRETFLTPSGGPEERRLGASPEVRIRCPQNMFDPILRRFADSFPHVDLRYETRYLGHSQDERGVRVRVQTRDGAERTLAADWLVACDGAGSGIRQELGIGTQGLGVLTYTTNVIFRCANLFALHDKALAYRHLFIGPEGVWATMVAINGVDQWRVQLVGNREKRQLTEAEIRAAIERIVGRPFDYEIVSVMPWVRRELVADRYRAGRVLLAGDAVHATSPTGGFGMNTGIGDSVDLAWKLAAVIEGWGGDGLLDSYELERRPVAQRAVREASGNLRRMMSPQPGPALLEPTYEGALARYELGRRYSATMLREWYKLGIDMGYTYAHSPLCVPEDEPPAPRPMPARHAISGATNGAVLRGALADGTPVTPSLLREWQRLALHVADGYPVQTEWQELPPEEVMIYRQTAAPGARAPHVWLRDGRSTLDLFGGGYVLLRLGADAPAADPLAAAAGARGVPLAVHALDEAEVLQAYRRRLVLVRPDGHVTWRGDDWPAGGVERLLDCMTGAAMAARQ